MHPIAYFTDTKDVFSDQDPFWKELLEPGGPWYRRKCNISVPLGNKSVNKRGMFAIQKLDDKPGTVKDVLKPIQVAEHLWYFGPKELPSQIELAREKIPFETETIRLKTGRTLSIPLVRSAPRYINSRKTLGDYASDFGRLGEEVFKKNVELEKLSNKEEQEKAYDELDSLYLKLVYKAIQECYKTTDDLLNDLNWVSDIDILPITEIIFGFEKKH